MPHDRRRFIVERLVKQGKLWPVVGLVGLRQSGKTTVMRKQLNIASYVSLDDDDALEASQAAPKVFMARQKLPVIIDEVQKSPKLFDTIKLAVDRQRIPGQYFLTGSSEFSARVGIRESLTGRIGLCQLFPMCIAEAKQLPPLKKVPSLSDAATKRRFTWQEILAHAERGGMPVPMFLRSLQQEHEYWKGWVETAIYRDMMKCFRGSYRPEIALSILRTMGSVLASGELPTLLHFDIDARRLRNYLEALETIFVARRIPCHSKGYGKDVWIFGDGGMAKFFMGKAESDGATLSLVRHCLWNETSSLLGALGDSDERLYFKSQRGNPIDWVWNNIPMKIVTSLQRQEWQERALHGAAKALGSKISFLIAPVDRGSPPPKAGGVGILPWSFWS